MQFSNSHLTALNMFQVRDKVLKQRINMTIAQIIFRRPQQWLLENLSLYVSFQFHAGMCFIQLNYLVNLKKKIGKEQRHTGNPHQPSAFSISLVYSSQNSEAWFINDCCRFLPFALRNYIKKPCMVISDCITILYL